MREEFWENEKKNFWKVLFLDPSLRKTNNLNLLSTDFLQKLEKSEA